MDAQKAKLISKQYPNNTLLVGFALYLPQRVKMPAVVVMPTLVPTN